ncbi:MAG: biotin/lipoyl-containing protein [Candidatus Pelethousia sp.]|nr:biotin/lipoyl-containing protein [Candidatus Pelethousia sp.]
MTQPELFELMKNFETGGLVRLEYEANGMRVLLEKGGVALPEPAPNGIPAAESAAAPEGQAEKADYIRTPLVGTYYAAPEPGKPPFVSAGDTVKKGQTVCIIEAMKMINEIPAPCDCVIEKALVENGTVAGYNEPLFLIRDR